jgi:hypothetical protein
VVNHSTKQTLAVSRIFLGIQNVLVPELVEVIPAFGVEPRHQHESRLLLQQS